MADLLETVSGCREAVLTWLEQRRRLLRLPGLQVAVRVRGELAVSAALGCADAERDLPLTTAHLFRIASHSKTFTATAVMMLRERGVLRLDDPVAHWVPELAGSRVGNVTVREMLGHQGGVIRDGTDSDFWQLMRPFPDADPLVAELRDNGAVFEPNEHFKYSNYGYAALGTLIGRASGKPYGEFVRTEICAPLGLDRVQPDLEERSIDQLAAGHALRLAGDDDTFVLRHAATAGMAAATGFVACAEDLTAYATAHTFGDDRLLSDASKRLMQRTESVVKVGDQVKGRYGLGLMLDTLGERELVGHSGGFPGFVTRTMVDPVDGLVVSVLTNINGAPAEEMCAGVLKLIDLAGKRPAERAGRVHDPERFTGLFANAWGLLQLATLGGRIVALRPMLADPTAEVTELDPADGDDLLRALPEAGYGPVGEPYRFTRDANGEVSSVRAGGGTFWPVEVFSRQRHRQMARR